MWSNFQHLSSSLSRHEITNLMILRGKCFFFFTSSYFNFGVGKGDMAVSINGTTQSITVSINFNITQNTWNCHSVTFNFIKKHSFSGIAAIAFLQKKYIYIHVFIFFLGGGTEVRRFPKHTAKKYLDIYSMGTNHTGVWPIRQGLCVWKFPLFPFLI